MSDRFKNLSTLDVFTLGIATPCLMISTYQTAAGWYYAIGLLLIAGALSFIVTGALIIFSYMMREYKKRGKYLRILFMFGFYLIFVSISFIGNFNSIYTNYIREELYREELQNSRNLVSSFANNYMQVIDHDKDSIKNNVLRIKRELLAEITKGENGLQGCGPFCEALMDSLKNLGLPRPNKPSPALSFQQQAATIGNEIDGHLSDKLADMELKDINIKRRLAAESDTVIKIVETSITEEDDYEASYTRIRLIYNGMVKALEGHMGTSYARKYPLLTFDPKNVGKWGFALEKARADWARRPEFLLVIIIVCLVIDLIVPILVIFLTPVDAVLQKEALKVKKEQEEEPLFARNWRERQNG